METLITVTQAAEKLDVHRTRVHAMIRAGQLSAIRTGSVLLINESELIAFKAIDRKPGRPPKPKDESASTTSVAEAVTTAETPATAAEPLTPKVKAKRAKKAVVAAPKAAKPKRAGKKAKAS